MSKVAPIPNIHPSCRVQVIDETQNPPRWKTIAECFDAPNPIEQAIRSAGLKGAWVKDCLGQRRYITLNKDGKGD